jgi:hypothetical protein
MAQRVARGFPQPVPNPDAVPASDAHLRTIAKTPPRDLTQRELLAGSYTLVRRLYGDAIEKMTLTDSTTVDISFETASGLRVELLSDGTLLTREDVECFLELYSDSRVLLVFAGPVGDDARDLCVDHPRIDYAAMTVERTKSDAQLLDWLNAHVSHESKAEVPA